MIDNMNSLLLIIYQSDKGKNSLFFALISLLEATDMTIDEITRAAGLEQASYLYKLYKKLLDSHRVKSGKRDAVRKRVDV